MNTNKSERLLNLLICCWSRASFVTKDRIRDVIDDYRGGSDEAFEKMFERDKDELRELGIPIEVGTSTPSSTTRSATGSSATPSSCPRSTLEPDEAAVVGLAARVWQHAGLADATSQALLKLKAAGIPVDREALDVVQPRLVADEPAFDAVWAATQSRTPVAFDYRRSGLGEPTRRHAAALGRASPGAAAGTSWATTATARQPRLFRLSRIVGDVRHGRRARRFAVPEGTDLRALARRAGARSSRRGWRRLRVRTGAGQALRRPRGHRRAEPGEGWDLLDVPYADLDDLAEEVLAYGPTLWCVEPPELRDARRRAARRAAGRLSDAASLVTERRPRPGGASAGAGALPAAPRRVRRRARSRATSASRPSRSSRDLKVLWFCGLPGLGTGRPDRDRHGGAGPRATA